MIISENFNLMKIRLITFILLLFTSLLFSQATITKKVIKETSELIIENSYKLLKNRAPDDLIDSYTKVLVKNGVSVKTRTQNKIINLFLKETYNLRGKEALIKVGQKLSSLTDKNLNNIKGFFAEEMHHNELLKLDGIENIQKSVKSKSTNYVQSKQKEFVSKNNYLNSDLYVHKNIEIDILGKKGNTSFIIEVKNIDRPFSDYSFSKYYSQIVKQKAYADENNIKKVFWSNIGKGLLTKEQLHKFEKLDVIVLQKGGESPLVNAKLNMNKIKRILYRLN